MAVVEYDPIRLGPREYRLRYISDLGGTPTYYIWRNGVLRDTTTSTTYDVFADLGDRVQFDVLDTAATPDTAYQSRARIWWNSVANAIYYTVSQRKDGGAWSDILRVEDTGAFVYKFWTSELDAGSTYDWKVTATDVNGNTTASPLTFTKKVDRKPDQPDWSYTWDADTNNLTLTVA